MKRYPVSVQLYSVREEAKKDFSGVLKKISGFGYTGVELAGFHGMAIKEVKKILDDLGLAVSSNHGAFPEKKNISEIVDTAETMGFKVHISGPGADLRTEEGCKMAAEKCQKASELLKGHGLSFGFHNHWHEFDHTFGGKTPHEIIMAGAKDLYAQIDTYWAALGGVDPVRVLRSNKGRICSLHMKDGPLEMNMPHTAVGEGKMNFAPIIQAAEEDKVIEWLIVELDTCATNMMTAVEKSVQYLVSKGWGKKK